MIRIYTTVLAIIFAANLQGQVVLQRMSDLMPEGYTISGDAFLEEMEDGTLQLRLSDDFTTPSGPDVRIILNNSLSSTGGVEVVNLSDIGHFNGALTVDVPAGVNIDDYDLIVFFCIQFQQLWASGTWTDSTPPGGGFECLDSDVSTVSGVIDVDICPTDGSADIVSFSNSLGLPAGANYAYLLTDENEILQEVISGDDYNFEGTSLSEQRVYGVHYDGDLSPLVGSNRSQTTASGCAVHSSSSDFVRITKNDCPPPFECLSSNTFSNGGAQVVDICPTDGAADFVFMSNDINVDPGEHYAFLITDENDQLLEVTFNSDYNFEGSSTSEQRIYGVHFDGSLNPVFNANRIETTATGCFTHSSSSQYITVTKNGCPPVFECESSTTSSNGDSTVDICPSDGTNDLVTLTNSLGVEPGDHYAYLITDENDVVTVSTTDAQYNFEGSGVTIQRVYGIHFDGTLDVKIGEHRDQTTASECFTHSDENQYLTITKNGCPPVFECESSAISSNGDSTVDICPTDGENDMVTLTNSLGVSPGDHYAYLITDENEVVTEMTTNTQYNFEGSGATAQRVYGIHFDGTLDVKIGAHRDQTTASECFTHSDANQYLTITKNGCPPPPPVFECLASLTATTGWATSTEICATDGEDDIVELRNNLFITPGDHYAYLITDANEIVLEVTFDSLYNFEGSGSEEQRVYGIHYDGTLDVKIGEDRMETTATECYIHSGGNLFLTINKTGCPPPPVFECLSSLTATTDWAISTDICPTDGIDDIIELRNNLFIAPGDHYAYLITDTNEVVLAMSMDTFYNFEGSGFEEQRVYGIHYYGELDVKIGENRLETTASECYEHSGGNLFLTIKKTLCDTPFECVESLTATHAWVTQVDICTTDGEADEVFLQNNINTAPGAHYAFLLTDSSETLLEVILDTLYDFEGLVEQEYRIYGLSYSGEIVAAIGETRKNTTASECAIHSGDNLYITISTSAACVTSTNELSIDEVVNVFPNPSTGNINIEYVNPETIKAAIIYDYTGNIVKNVTGEQSVFVNYSGLYTLLVRTETEQYVRRIVVVK